MHVLSYQYSVCIHILPGASLYRRESLFSSCPVFPLFLFRSWGGGGCVGGCSPTDGELRHCYSETTHIACFFIFLPFPLIYALCRQCCFSISDRRHHISRLVGGGGGGGSHFDFNHTCSTSMLAFFKCVSFLFYIVFMYVLIKFI